MCLQNFFNTPVFGACAPPSPIFSCKKFRFEPSILKQNIYPRPTHHTSPMYDTIREDNDHIVKIYISFVLNVAAGLTKMCLQQNVYAGAFCSRVCTEYTTPSLVVEVNKHRDNDLDSDRVMLSLKHQHFLITKQF